MLRGLVREIDIKRGKGTEEDYWKCELLLHREISKYFDLPFDIFGNMGYLDMRNGGEPLIFSYEKIPNQFSFAKDYEIMENPFYVLWDVNHNITPFADLFNLNYLNRMNIFIKGLEKIMPENLALELSCDYGQRIIDRYMKGDIGKEEVNDLLTGSCHMSTGLDNYSLLLDFAKNNGTNVQAVDIEWSEYDNIFELPSINIDGLTKEEKIDRISKLYRIPSIKAYVQKLCEDGSTLLILGAAHRPNLIEAFRIET